MCASQMFNYYRFNIDFKSRISLERTGRTLFKRLYSSFFGSYPHQNAKTFKCHGLMASAH